MTDVSPQPDTLPPPPRRAHYACLALVFVAIAVYGSWVPFEPIALSSAEAWQIVRAGPLISFGRIDRSDWATNVLIIIPISFCLLGACAVDGQRPKIWLPAIPAILIACLALSICLEGGQLWLPPRYFSGNDILAQIVGAVSGIVLWLFAGEPFTRWLRSYSGRPGARRQISWLLQAYLAGLLIYAVLPLDLTIHPEEVYRKIVSRRLVLIPFADTTWNWTTLGELLTDVVVFIPVGALAVIGWLPPEKQVRPVDESIFIGGAIVLAVEICQFPVMSRFTDATDVVTGIVGVAIGAAAMSRLASHEGDPTAGQTGLQTWHWMLLTGIYTLIVIVYFWLPFDLIENRSLIRARFHQLLRVPGAGLLAVSQFRALTAILQKILLFLPLGALLARTAYRPGARGKTRGMRWGLCLAYAAALALVVEVGQILNIHHTPDLSDALICTAAASLGMLIAARLFPGER